MNPKQPLVDTPEDSANQADSAASPETVAAERDRLLEEKNDLQDRLLRRQAEFDNFRRRADREKSEIIVIPAISGGGL